MKNSIIILVTLLQVSLNYYAQKQPKTYKFKPELDYTEQRQNHIYEDTQLKCSYQTNKGRIDGEYISYYKNGKKKAEGRFENNYRIGNWMVWDSSGKMIIQKEYQNPFVFKSFFPKAQEGKLNIPTDSIYYNKDGYIVYSHLTEEMVAYSMRIWRFVSENNNQAIFEHDRLFQIFQKNIINKNITAYGIQDDEFRNPLSVNQLVSLNSKIIGFKIKEDFFIDKSRKISETRIIGICPVGLKEGKDTIDLYWLYYPELRKYLANEKLYNSASSKIKTFDDLFFYRDFASTIYKQSNVYDKPISAYKKGQEIAKEAERIEIEIIEADNDYWIYPK